jgi:hypothetical protein
MFRVPKLIAPSILDETHPYHLFGFISLLVMDLLSQ